MGDDKKIADSGSGKLGPGKRKTSVKGALLRFLPKASTFVVLGILAMAVVLRIADPLPIETLRVKTFDLFNRFEPRTPPNPSPVTIVDIDEKSLAEVGQWPWPRTQVAELVAKLRNAGAAVVGFDMVFAEPDRTSPERLAKTITGLPPDVARSLSGLPDNDGVFGQIVRTARVVAGQSGSTEVIEQPPSPASEETSVKGALGVSPLKFVERFPHLIHNVDPLEAAASGRGFFSLSQEVDGLIRRVPIVGIVDGVLKPALSLDMLRVGLGGNSILTNADEAGLIDVRVQTPQGNFPVPTDSSGRLWVYYAQPDANLPPEKRRLYVSAADVLSGTAPQSRLAGHLVLVGTSAVGLKDIRATPLESRLPGVEVHANILETILTQDFISYPRYMNAVELLLMVMAGLALLFLVPRVGPVWTLVGLGVVSGGIVGLSWYLFTTQRILVDMSFPGMTVFAVYSVLAFSNYARDATEKRQVRTAFSQYLSPDLVAELAANPERLRLGGETRKMTLLFCDVRGFTTISEQFKTDPQGLTRLINRLLTPLTQRILERRGTIDKYMGDCIMAFWNAPLEDPRQEENACRSALEMFEALKSLNEERRKEAEEEGIEFLPLNIGIGINTGDCVVGNMGSEQRFDYSVLGDAVNLASRLEGQSKGYHVGIVIGAETADAVSGSFAVPELDLIAVKGKKEAVRIHTVLGDETVLNDPEYKSLKAGHDEMLTLYRTQRFEEALKRIESLRGRLGGVMDGFYDLYEERIREYLENPPPSDWDGVYIATSK